jgi:hypothetical protein
VSVVAIKISSYSAGILKALNWSLSPAHLQDGRKTIRVASGKGYTPAALFARQQVILSHSSASDGSQKTRTPLYDLHQSI